MPTKLGKGGAGQQDYDESTGQYSNASSIRYKGNKYQANIENKWIDIEKTIYDTLKSKGIKEEVFDEDRIIDYLGSQVNLDELKSMSFPDIKNKLRKDGVPYPFMKSKQAREISEEVTEDLLKTFKTMPKNDINSSLSGANPKYKESYEYKINCQRCVTAFLLRMKGYDVQAKPNKSTERVGIGNESLSYYAPTIYKPDGDFKISWSYSVFNLPQDKKYDYAGKVGSRIKTQKQDIINTVSNMPDGAICYCYVDWKHQNGSHIFVVMNDKGTVKFIDPQNGKDVEWYFSDSGKYIRPSETALMRVDDLPINGWVLQQEVE